VMCRIQRLPMLRLIAAAWRHRARTPEEDRKWVNAGRAHASGGS